MIKYRHHSLVGAILWATMGLACRKVDGSGGVPRAPVRLHGTFVVFGLCTAKMSPAGQVAAVTRAGYSGLGLPRFDPTEIETFARLPEVASGRFRIPSVMWWSKVGDSIPYSDLRKVLPQAQRMDMAIWMVAAGRRSDSGSLEAAIRKYALVAEMCRQHGVSLVLYPHAGTVIENVEQSLDVLDSLRRLGYPEVKTSLHLCHELKAGNLDRLDSIITKAAPYLGIVTVNGAEPGLFGYRRAGWDRLIEPLDRGTFDIHPMLDLLARSGYGGPIELHTYNLKNPSMPDYDNHLERSLRRWRELVIQPSSP